MAIFDSIKPNKVKRNKFSLSHERKLSMNMGDLVPIMCQEIVPGDNFRVNTETLMRLAPMLAPIMHRVNVYTHYFFVPNRLVYDGWQDFITGNNPNEELPYIPVTHDTYEFFHSTKQSLGRGSLADHLGIPPVSGELVDPQELGQHINAMPFRAYQLIWVLS